MKKKEIIVGTKNEKLTIIREIDKCKISSKRMIECLCDCGNTKIIKWTDFRRTKSCGCFIPNKLSVSIGTKFSKLTVVNEELSQNGARYFKCQCECGKEKIIKLNSLIMKKTQSCGCLQIASAKSKDPWLSEFNYVRNAAKKRGLAWDLTRNQFQTLCSKPCHYCNSSPSTTTHRKGIIKNGIDRVNNKLGYWLSNCVPCCKMCNIAKHTWDLDEFHTWVKKIYSHMNVTQKNTRQQFYHP